MSPVRPMRSLLCSVVAHATLLTGLAAGFGASFAQTPPAPPEAIREEVAIPLSAAGTMIKEKKYTEAFARIRAAEAVPARTPAENVAIERTRAVAAFGAGDIPTAIRSFEAVLASDRVPPAEEAKLMQLVAQLYFQTKDFPMAAVWAARALKVGSPNEELRSILVQSQYFSGDCANASRELRALADAERKAGMPPNRERLSMLASCYLKLGDDAGYAYALDQTLSYYPTKEYWADAIRRVEAKPGFPERLRLDVLRLRRATGTLDGIPAHVAMIQLAMQAALPGEAKKIADEGFSSGVLGTGGDADEQKKLRDAATKAVSDDEKQLPQNAKTGTTAKDGTTLLNVGFAYVMIGQFEYGIPMMEQGIAKGGLREPEDAKLHLGIAYLAAGKKSKAIEVFKEVGGNDGTADLARLWLIHARRPA
jgi:tetratricopeptide (TPR) repeat protein